MSSEDLQEPDPTGIKFLKKKVRSKKDQRKRFKATPDEIEKTEQEQEHEKGLTNKLLTQDIEGTKEMWSRQGYTEIKPEEVMSLKGRTFIKYITTRKQARQGGIIIKFNRDPNYVVLFNPNNKISWSVQIKNIKSAYIKTSDPESESESESEFESESEEEESSESE